MTEHTEHQSHNVLRIVDGLHAGASRVLAEEEMILVGSGEDCDIVLADDGVAAHHALVSLVGGRFLVRALDAPVKVGAQDIHPGDPVEMSAVQQVYIGDAVIAFGREDDPAWDAFVTVFAPDDEAQVPRSGFVRKLPWIAGFAALSLASLAIFAAVLPAPEQGPDKRERLDALLDEHRVTHVQVSDGADGRPTVTGAVDDAATLERLRQQVRAENIEATLQIRTGEHIAGDVAEIFRAHSIPVQARYIGNGDVEVVGEFENGAEIERIARSRSVSDIPGVQRIVPRTPAGLAPGGVELPVEPPQAHIVSIVRGENPHLVSSDGRRFVPGDTVPGKGELISIGEFAHVLGENGELTKVIPGPPPTDEDAETATAAAGDGAETGADPRFSSVVANVSAGARSAQVTPPSQ